MPRAPFAPPPTAVTIPLQSTSQRSLSMTRLVRNLFLAALAAATPLLARAQDKHLQPGDTVAVIGDSITEQKMYSVFIEDYLLMCQPAAPARIMQFGWGGETA